MAGRVAVVTGAARGIGAATVLALVEQGWAVLAVDLATDDPALPYPMGTKAELRRSWTSTCAACSTLHAMTGAVVPADGGLAL